VNDFDRNIAFQPVVPSSIYHAHPAGANLLYESIVA
jgi:hypothetical protein